MSQHSHEEHDGKTASRLYGQNYEWLMQHRKEIGRAAADVYSIIAAQDAATGKVFLANDTMAAKTGLSVRSVEMAINDLCRIGLILTALAKGSRESIVVVKDHPWMADAPDTSRVSKRPSRPMTDKRFAYFLGQEFRRRAKGLGHLSAANNDGLSKYFIESLQEVSRETLEEVVATFFDTMLYDQDDKHPMWQQFITKARIAQVQIERHRRYMADDAFQDIAWVPLQIRKNQTFGAMPQEVIDATHGKEEIEAISKSTFVRRRPYGPKRPKAEFGQCPKA